MVSLKTYKKSLLTLILCCALVPSSSSASFWHSWSKKQKTVAVITASALGLTALGYYLYSQYQDLIDGYNQAYKQIDIQNLQEALFKACQNGNLNAVKLLIGKGTNINQVNNGHIPLRYACFHGHLDIAQLLIDNGADVDKADINGQTLLHYACFYNHLDTVQLLIDNGADINKANTNGSTPLHIACHYGHLEIVKLLTQHGAKTDAKTLNGVTLRGFVWHEPQPIINYLDQLEQSEKDFDDATTQATPELLQRFIACKIHDTYVLEHFSKQNKKVQQELMFHALLHNTDMLMKFYYSDPKCGSLLTMLTENNYLQARYKQLLPQKNANGWKKESSLSNFADITITFKQ